MTSNFQIQEMQTFWIDQVNPIIGSLFSVGCTFTKLALHFQENDAMIYNRYSLHPFIDLFEDFPADFVIQDHAFNPFGCILHDSQPKIGIVLPELKRYFDNALSHDKGIDKRVLVMIPFLHETDHLGLGLVVEKNAVLDHSERIRMESLAWARTCEKCLVPLVKLYEQKLPYGVKLFYDAWEKFKGDSQSKKWKDFIASQYKAR